MVAFFSIAETSMMAVNRYKLATMAGAGHRGAQRAQSCSRRPTSCWV